MLVNWVYYYFFYLFVFMFNNLAIQYFSPFPFTHQVFCFVLFCFVRGRYEHSYGFVIPDLFFFFLSTSGVISFSNKYRAGIFE